MTDVYIVALLTIGIFGSSVGLQVALNAFLPRMTDRAAVRLAHTPLMCFILGLVITVPLAGLIAVLASLSAGVLQGVAFLLGGLGLGVRAIGGAGLARLLGERFPHETELWELSRGSMLLNAAQFAPIVGWFLVLPLAGITMIGAAAFALVGWQPKAARQREDETPPIPHSETYAISAD